MNVLVLHYVHHNINLPFLAKVESNQEMTTDDSDTGTSGLSYNH